MPIIYYSVIIIYYNALFHTIVMLTHTEPLLISFFTVLRKD